MGENLVCSGGDKRYSSWNQRCRLRSGNRASRGGPIEGSRCRSFQSRCRGCFPAALGADIDLKTVKKLIKQSILPWPDDLVHRWNPRSLYLPWNIRVDLNLTGCNPLRRGILEPPMRAVSQQHCRHFKVIVRHGEMQSRVSHPILSVWIFYEFLSLLNN